jgi:hypothetical protein
VTGRQSLKEGCRSLVVEQKEEVIASRIGPVDRVLCKEELKVRQGRRGQGDKLHYGAKKERENGLLCLHNISFLREQLSGEVRKQIEAIGASHNIIKHTKNEKKRKREGKY